MAASRSRPSHGNASTSPASLGVPTSRAIARNVKSVRKSHSPETPLWENTFERYSHLEPSTVTLQFRSMPPKPAYDNYR